MPDFVYNWPLWITGILLTALFVGVAAIAVVVRRRLFPLPATGDGDGEFTATMVHSMMVFYALVAALIAVGVWERHADVATSVTGEATALLALYRDVSDYPEPARTQLRDAIRAYTEQIIHEAWPQQRRGIVPSGGVARVDRIQELLLPFEPTTDGQKLLHGETLRQYDAMVDARHHRVDANHERLPGMMWWVDIVGGILCLVGASLFRVERAGFHIVSAGLLAALMSMILFMTLALERPYRGDLGIGAEAYELVLDHVMAPNGAAEHAR